MLNIAGEWLLFEGLVAAAILGEGTRAELYESCLFYWTRTPKTEELLRLLELPPSDGRS